MSSSGASQIEQDYLLVENEGLFQEYLEMGKKSIIIKYVVLLFNEAGKRTFFPITETFGHSYDCCNFLALEDQFLMVSIVEVTRMTNSWEFRENNT